MNIERFNECIHCGRWLKYASFGSPYAFEFCLCRKPKKQKRLKAIDYFKLKKRGYK